MNKPMCWMSVLVFCSALAVGCGDDDSATKTTDGGGDSGAHNDGGLSADAAAGTGGMRSMGGTGGSMMTAMPIKCGSNMCAAAAGPLGGTACCADKTAGTCGMMSGSMCNPPPKVDPSCPTIMIPVIGMMGSCCAANGMCGLDGSALGMGCVDYKMVTTSLGILGGLITLPPAQSCGDNDAGTNDDAGP